MNLLTSPHITWQSRNTFINIYSIITKNFLSMTALGHNYSVYYRKMLVRLWYMLNRTLKTNVEPRWPLKSNLELPGRFLCATWFELFSQLATPGRSYAREIRNHSCGWPVEWKNERTRQYLRSERPSRIRPVLVKGTPIEKLYVVGLIYYLALDAHIPHQPNMLICF